MKPICPIQAVSFDVGGTLVEPWPSVGHVYAAVAAESGLPAYGPAHLNENFARAWRSKSGFDYSRKAWADIVVNTFAGEASQFGVLTEFFARLYERFAESSAWQVYPDVLPVMETLRLRGLKLAVISNWDDRLRLLLRNLKLDSYFDAIEVSVECGFHKPSPEIFRRVLDRLELPASAVLHVGDSFVEDFQGARSVGMQAVLLRRGKITAAQEHIHSLTQVLELIGG